MLFNSVSFLFFLPIVFVLYWFAANKNLTRQNVLLLLASYFFYASWDWRFLFLLMFSTLLDYYTGIKMSDAKSVQLRKVWFWLSISINLGFLGVFKYYNFFVTSFAEAISHLGLHVDTWTLKVVLPIGISFYTFHGLSYVIDIYKGKIGAERNFIDYSLFVSFFPLLVAGPIERATHLLPQIGEKRVFRYGQAVEGLRQILWGLFKKVVIADQCAIYANMIFNNVDDYSGIVLVLGAVFFAFQIYGDFSGYSDIAIGTAKLFGIELLRNFAFPYFSRDIAEFWRRWHISLSTWFRDYLYIPLGGSKGNVWIRVRNTFIIFLVSGFWHGANWTFIVWGLLNALYIMPSIVLATNRNSIDIVAQGKYLPTVRELFSIVITFSLTTFAWIFFRSESLTQAIDYIYRIGHSESVSKTILFPSSIFVLIVGFMMFEWMGREKQFALQVASKIKSSGMRLSIYYAIMAIILVYGNFDGNQFIYFEF